MSVNQRILIANRGEVAVRAMRTMKRLGFETVAAYSDADANGVWLKEATATENIGPAAVDESYLSIPALLAAAERSKATAVFPGYGLLSESAEFAQAVVDAGLIWIGPNPGVLTQMTDKIEARRLAEVSGLRVVPGHCGMQTQTSLVAAARKLGFPLLIKAVAGRGGKGIRRVDKVEDMAEALAEVKAEAIQAFGDGDVLLERLLGKPRHLEVQILADRLGNVVHFGTRECSLQRRFQKIVEEAPAPNLSESDIELLCSQAVSLATDIGYDSIGTVEFLLDSESGAYFFLGMNTRLQVEHSVSEAIANVDFVELMLFVAFGNSLENLVVPDAQGHAIEARVMAEDPWREFAPQAGVVSVLSLPEGHRWDSAVEVGSEVNPLVDPLVGKLVSHGSTRAEALTKLRDALSNVCIGGLVANTGFLHWLLNRPELESGGTSTQYVDENMAAYLEDHPEPGVVLGACEAARVAAQSLEEKENPASLESPWSALTSKRFLPTPARTPHLFYYRQSLLEVSGPVSNARLEGAVVNIHGESMTILRDAHSTTLRPLARSLAWTARPQAPSGDGSSEVLAPFPATIVDIRCQPGSVVDDGSILVVIESMKLLHSLRSPRAGTVSEVDVIVGDTITEGERLVLLEPKTETEAG